MKLLLLNVKGREKVTLGLLRDAARELHIPVLEIDPEYPLPDLDACERYLLYRICIHSHDKEIALYRRYYVTSHAGTYSGLRGTLMERFRAAGVPVPAFTFASEADPDHLQSQVDAIGGFPVVVKAPQKRGGNGIGIIKVDSLESLQGLAPLLLEGESRFRLMQYISHKRGGRLIVVGDRVVSSHEVERHHLDFRTNREDRNPSRKRVDYPEWVNQIAVRATHANGYTFGGVDIMFSDNDEPYLTEVNFPCYFATTEQTTGFPVAKALISFLAKRCGEREHKFDRPWPSPLPAPSHEGSVSHDRSPELLQGGPTNTEVTVESLTEVTVESLTETAPVLCLLAQPDQQEDQIQVFRKAAANFGLETVVIDAEDELPRLPAADQRLLVRICAGHVEREIELYRTYHCVSATRDYPILAADDYDQEEQFDTHDVPYLSKMAVRGKDIRYLKAQTEHVGGFPLLIRLHSKSLPRFIVAESFDSFVSIVDFARFLGHQVEIRTLAEITRAIRAIVLGDRVIAALEYLLDDPPCRGVDRDGSVTIGCVCPESASPIAISAAKSVGLTFAAVDLLFVGTQIVVDDVFHPFDVAEVQQSTGVPVAELLIEYLLDELPEISRADPDGLTLAYE